MGFAAVRASGGIEVGPALAAYDEAFAIWRALAETNPDAHLPNLANGLLSFVGTRATSGVAPADAMEAIEEAIAIYEQIVEATPEHQMHAMGLWGAYHTRVA